MSAVDGGLFPTGASVLAFFPAFLAVLVHLARAAEPFQVAVSDAVLASSGTGKVIVTVAIPPEYHIFRDMLEVSVLDGGALKVGAPAYPKGELGPDPVNPGQTREFYEEFVAVDVPVTAVAGVTGKQYVKLSVRYQACKASLCTLPATEELTAAVTVGGSQGAALRVHPAFGLVGALWTAPALAQAPGEEVAVVFTPGPASADQLGVHVDLQGEWHLNKMFMSVRLPEAADLTLGDPTWPPAHPSGSKDDGSYREDFTADFDFVVPVSGPAGKRTVQVEVGYQACKGVSLCRMPTVALVEVPIELMGGASAATPAPAVAPPAEATPPAPPVVAAAPTAAPASLASVTPPPVATAGTGSQFEAAAKQGTYALLLLCFLAGVGVSFTPCVLPMVPITLAIIGAKSAGSKLVAFSRSAAYVAGQGLVYTGLAVVIALTGGMFGSWLQSPWVVGTIATVFVIMGGGMFGWFDIGMPNFIASRLQGGERGGGFFGPFVVGMIGALVAGPCSGPVVVSILAVIGHEGKVALGAALMAAFSLGMGMIFLVAGTATGWLPSRGPWMVVVKKGFGILLWLGALYFAAPQLPAELTVLLTGVVLLSTAVFSWPHPDDGEGIVLERLRQVYAIGGGTIGVALLVGSALRYADLLPVAGVASASPSGVVSTSTIQWRSDAASAEVEAQQSGKPMLIDFTAEWCAACHEMEKFTYTDAKVAEAARGFVTVMVDCTKGDDPRVRAVQEKYGVMGLPTVVFVTADGRVIDRTTGYVPAPDFLPHLQAALASAG